MKFKLLLLLSVSLLTAGITLGQADLILTAAGFSPAQIDRGEIFNVTATVTNDGNTVAAENYLFIYYSTDLTISTEEIVSRVSVKELAPGESQEVNFIYPVSSALPAGSYYIGYELDPFDEVPEMDEDNLFCAANSTGCVTFGINSPIVNYQKYTYPILFVHGWTGNDETWDDFNNEAIEYYGWSYGGRLDYCLNPDGDQSTSDGFYLDLVDETSLSVGDFYRVNFDISADGQLYVGNDGIAFNDDYSNQSAIVKQGWAVSDAVQRVLEITEAEKVILVGHSMGGLASREYLQNPENWQSDGQHHIAKLLTVGTPNGGSNAGFGNIGGLIGYDEFSEAVRDLRWKNIIYDGDYLDGGTEDNFSVYYNNDIDCNGFVGDLITGLNEKISPEDVEYACVVGVIPSTSGDGVVSAARADLNNYLLAQPPLSPPHADRFDVTTSHLSIHKENHSILVRGLDEPDFYDLAYPVPLNSLNYGFSTEQAPNHLIPPPDNIIDWDDFIIEVPENGLLEVKIWNIPVHDFALFLLDANYNILEEVQAAGESNIEFSTQLTPGQYFVETGSIPTSNSWRFPYAYTIEFTPDEVLTAAFSSNAQSGCAPFTVNFEQQAAGNPENYEWVFDGGSPATSTDPNPSVTYNEPGVYNVSLTVSNANDQATASEIAYITVDDAAEATFSYEIEPDRVVDFSNQTTYSLEAPSYQWDFGDGQMSTQTNPVHTYEEDGMYTVKLSAENECGISEQTQNLEIITVSTEVLDGATKVIAFPVPASDKVHITVESPKTGNCRIVMTAPTGQIIREKIRHKSAKKLIVPIDVSGLPSGIYYFNVYLATMAQTLRIVKE